MKTLILTAAAILAATAVFAADAAQPDGKALFGAKCASCHAKDGKGSPAMAKMFKVDAAKLDLTGKDVQGMKDADLTGVVSAGKNKMPAFKGKMKDAELAAVTAYIRTLTPKDGK